jgi:hypothetical protein
VAGKSAVVELLEPDVNNLPNRNVRGDRCSRQVEGNFPESMKVLDIDEALLSRSWRSR